jgi:Kef-type K+ transport system membrane component KefB
MLNDLALSLQIVPWPPRLDGVVITALVLVAGALLGGWVERGLGWPRVMGYSAVGMAVAWAGWGVADGRLPVSWRLIVDLALAVLLFELGTRVHLRWLRANPALLLTSAAEYGLAFGAIFLALRTMGWAGIDAAVVAAVLAATGASVVGRVLVESRASGQVSERLLLLAALDTLYAVLAFKLIHGGVRIGDGGFGLAALAPPLYTLGASLLLAALLARLVIALAPRLDLRDENAALLLLGLVLLALGAARMFGASTLLVPLAAGVLLRNASPRPWLWPRHFGTAGGVLVVMLFVIVGASWSMPVLAAGAAVAVAVLAARAVGKTVAVVALSRFSGATLRQGSAVALGLMPVSAVALVLLNDLHGVAGDAAARVGAVVLAAIVLAELLGPLALQGALALAREQAQAPGDGEPRS